MIRSIFLSLIAVVLADTQALAATDFATNSATTVATKYGVVIGAETNDDYVFKGITYAAAPVGALRFAPTQPPRSWAKPFVADTFGEMCPQVDLVTKKVVGSEDCLKMNIWRPKNITHALPVMVFIHGGGNSIGSGSKEILGVNLYDGTELSKQGAIIVTLNYRLGPLGFLAQKSLERSNGQVGNYAVLDEIQALKFVQENIAHFGGDPQNVTLFGESSGAINILIVLASPLSHGLFQRSIIESSFMTELPAAEAEAQGDTFAKAVGCDGQADTAACLRALPADVLVNAYAHTSSAALVPASGTIDGVVLKRGVLETIQAGDYQHMPILIGSNHDEFRTLAPFLSKMSVVYTDADYVSDLQKQFGAAKTEKIHAFYPWKQYGTPRLAVEAALTDSYITCPTRQLTRAFIKDTPETYRYMYTHVGQNPVMAPMGAGHGTEVAYVFGNLNHAFYTLQEYGLSAQMRNYWGAFARTSNPNVAQQTAWPTVADDNYLDLNINSQAGTNFRGNACDFWDQLTASNGANE